MTAKRINILEKQAKLKRPLVLDGAMGSLLQQKGLASDKYLWHSNANIENPEIVKSLHKDYILAGAEIITTNTFRTNPVALKRPNYTITNDEFVLRGVQLAIDAREDREVIIAGSNAPAEDCYQKERTVSKYELDYNHKKHIELLWESGVDIIWNETQSHSDEIKIICRFCSENSLPYTINFYFEDDLKLLSGEPLAEAVEFVKDFKPSVIGFNCIKTNTFKKFYEKFPLPKNFGFYFNCGAGNVNDAEIICGVSPENYIKEIEPYLKYNPLFTGSCCGSSPLHTKKIKEYFDEIYRN
ncbi:MAG: homocysteine S-methyltransferase family protein [Ignavibacteriales bacterium]|nr:homocysteine S-methyltransferase family protein [Ignavibacteriales bacterium]